MRIMPPFFWFVNDNDYNLYIDNYYHLYYDDIFLLLPLKLCVTFTPVDAEV